MIVAGGYDDRGTALDSTELFHSTDLTFYRTAAELAACGTGGRRRRPASGLDRRNGRHRRTGRDRRTEDGRWSPGPGLRTPRVKMGAAWVGAERVLVVGGSTNIEGRTRLASTELVDLASGRVSVGPDSPPVSTSSTAPSSVCGTGGSPSPAVRPSSSTTLGRTGSLCFLSHAWTSRRSGRRPRSRPTSSSSQVGTTNRSCRHLARCSFTSLPVVRVDQGFRSWFGTAMVVGCRYGCTTSSSTPTTCPAWPGSGLRSCAGTCSPNGGERSSSDRASTHPSGCASCRSTIRSRPRTGCTST